uniref:Uncharacterized protein n=1 Tax=Anguilla anguilla TaxID=7936 RepID=A0A0E9UHX3_ANGAN
MKISGLHLLFCSSGALRILQRSVLLFYVGCCCHPVAAGV